jgi:hypothetical protein
VISQRHGWGYGRVLLAGAIVGVLTPVRVYSDSIGYISSAMSLYSTGFSRDYSWLREPLYPVFLRVLLELPPTISLHAIPMIQGMALASGFWLFAAAARGMGLLDREEPATYYALTCLLVTGYSGAILQQPLMVFTAGSLAFCAVRLATAPIDRRILVVSGAAATFAILLSSVFLVPVALLPFAPSVLRLRFTWPPFVAVWGSGALALTTWMAIRLANGQAFGLGGTAVLDRPHAVDWPLRIQAFLATFGLAPDFYDSAHFNVLSYSNISIGLAPYIGQQTCAAGSLADLRSMPATNLICGSPLGPHLPQSLGEPLSTIGILQVLVGVIALAWACSAASPVRLYALVLAITMAPCLPVALLLGDGNSRYGLPVLSLSLVLTVGMATRAWQRARAALSPTSSQPRGAAP